MNAPDRPAAERITAIIEKHLEKFSEIEQARMRRAGSAVMAKRRTLVVGSGS